VTILALHLGLRPVSRWIDARVKIAVDVETAYRMMVVCQAQQEVVVRTILMRHVNSDPRMVIQRITTQEAARPDEATIVVDIFSVERADRALEDLMSRVNIEPSVSAVSWQKVQLADA
jgi:putative Mg2+ transporter-C (MgtC) family protein